MPEIRPVFALCALGAPDGYGPQRSVFLREKGICPGPGCISYVLRQGHRAGRAGEKPDTTKKRSHLVIGESALLIADYFDRVSFLKISR